MPEHHNRVTGPVFHPVVQARDISGGVHISPTFTARSRYREQVRQIAPAELIGREAELAELAAFCLTDDDADAYRWWRAPKWAGKSALLSWFVLHPPPGVRVVSFFVTGRLAGQDHRGAFVDVVLEQLAELLGEPLPTFLPETTREAHLVGMLAEAAALCRARGERLVLVVDGLDEDRGATGSAGAHSIAALLPARPAAGLRVVVSGRPNPPPPADLSRHHPLRDPSIVRDLAVSAQARVLRDDMELELDRLLRGGPVERDLLGLVVSAAGGLSGRDLAELTGHGEHEVRRQLRTVAGRSFDVRPSHWQPDTGIYLLGHEELQASAEERLGGALIAGYRERLHRWADGYRESGWPADTPEYLLRGYHRLLVATGDTARMVACATDPARHDRMLALSGGDVDALTEIGAAQDVLLAADRPDVVALARLAVHRDRLVKRGSTIPERLPALWARLGNVARAEALTDPVRKPAAAAHLVGALVATGHLDRAEALAVAITDPDHRADALLARVRALVDAGRPDLAEPVVRHLLGSRARVTALALLARAAAGAGDRTGAFALAASGLEVAESLPGGPLREGALGAAAEAATAAGDLRGAEEICDAITERAVRLPVLARLVARAAEVGDHTRARRLALAVEHQVDATPAPDRDHSPLVVAMAATRDAAEVEARVSAIDVPHQRVGALVALAVETRDAGPLERAVDLLPDVEPRWRAREATERVVDALLELGAVGRAEEVATAADARWPWTLVAIGHAAVTAGQPDVARRLAAEAETAARSTSGVEDGLAALRALVLAHAAHGDPATSRRLAAALEAAARDSGPEHLSQARLCLVRAAIDTGEPERAEHLAAAIEDDGDRTEALRLLVRAALARGDHAAAERLANLVADPQDRVELLVELLRRLAAAGAADRVAGIVAALPDGYSRLTALTAVLEEEPAFATRAAGFADSLPHLPWRAALLTAAVRATRGDDHGLVTRTEAVIRQMANPYAQVRALIHLADAVSAGGGRAVARSMLARAGVVLPGIARPSLRSRAALDLASALVALGHSDCVAVMAESFDHRAYRARAQTLLARAPATAERFDLAVEAASVIEVARYRVEARLFLVKALAAAGRVDQALDQVEEITAERPRARALVSVIGALAATSADPPFGRIDALIGATTDPRHRSDALEALAGAALRRGSRALAEAAVAAIPLPARQAAMWRSLLDDPASRAIGRPAARLLSVVDWPAALDAVVAAHPEVLDAVTAEFDLTSG